MEHTTHLIPEKCLMVVRNRLRLQFQTLRFPFFLLNQNEYIHGMENNGYNCHCKHFQLLEFN